MENPLVSIIVPCFNQAQFISETLDSVLGQTYKNWECIIVNDGSTDNTEQIAKDYCAKDRRFKYIFKQNGGLSSARNTGIRETRGDYLQFLDSDDLLLADKIEIQLSKMLSDKSIDISISRYRLFRDNVGNQFDIDRSLSPFQCTLDGFLYRWNIDFVFPPVCYLVKMEFLKRNSILFNENVKAIEDWIFLVCILLKGANFYVEQNVLALYRRHTLNMSNDKKLMSTHLIKASFIVFDLLRPEIKDDYMENKSLFFVENFAKEFKESENAKRANSIDYKLGYSLLYPLHKLSGNLKKIIRILRK
jgi:hypothetical protein